MTQLMASLSHSNPQAIEIKIIYISNPETWNPFMKKQTESNTHIFDPKQRAQHQKQSDKNRAKPARKEVSLPWLPTMRLTTVWLKEEDTIQKVWT